MNPGVYPLDPTTDVGRLRALLGDTSAIELSPPVVGQRDYAVFSDVALASYIAITGSNLFRAAAAAVQTLALASAQTGGDKFSIKADDLGLTIGGDGASLSDIVTAFLRQADAVDAGEVNDFFEVVAPATIFPRPYAPYGTRPSLDPLEEGQPNILDGGLL